jgi:hypothetical protein
MESGMAVTAVGTPLARPSVPDPVEHEARLVGLRRHGAPTLEAVDRRRSQLWSLAFSSLVCLAAGVALLATAGHRDLGIANTLPFRIGTVLLVVGLAAYVMDKEHHLRSLSEALISERVSAAAMSERLKELESFHAAGTAMNSVLVIEEVLRVILTSAVELLHPVRGSILITESPTTLAVVCAVGETADARTRVTVGEGLAGRVAAQRVPILIEAHTPDGLPMPAESAICVPLIHREQLLGVLELHGATDHVYTDLDLRSVSLFADHAAIAIANSRLTAAKRALTEQLSEARGG